MNKAQLVSLVKKGMGEDGRLGDRTIALAIDTVWQEVVKDLFIKTPGKLDFYSKQYKNVAVLQDDDTDEYYCLLPEEIVQTVAFEEGIRNIRLKGPEQIDFVPLDISPSWIGNTDVGLVVEAIGYMPRQDRVLFYNMNPDIEEVIMDLVVPFDKWDDDDPVNLPQGASMKIVGMAIQLLGGVPYIDPKQRKTNTEMK
jgi:hypothetical protein